MTCGDGERTRSRACTAGCSNIDDNDSNHSLIQSEVCNQTECPQRCGTLTWNDSIQVEENQLLAGGLQMNTTFRLRFEVFLRSTGPNTWRSVFFANDGPTITRQFFINVVNVCPLSFWHHKPIMLKGLVLYFNLIFYSLSLSEI